MKEILERSKDIPKNLRHKVASPIWDMLVRRMDFEFTEESKRNLFSANEQLKQNSLIIYINHTNQTEDVAIPLLMTFNFLTNANRIIGPAAMQHYDSSRDRKSAMLLRFIKPLGIEVFPIVQSGGVDKRASMYSNEKTQQMSDDLRTATISAIRGSGSVFGIAPEGTRSKDGKLLFAKRGIGYFESYDSDHRLSYLPVAVVLRKFSDHSKVEVGKPLQLGDMNLENSNLPEDPTQRAQLLTDIHMQRLANMLPPEMRGVYLNKDTI